MPAFLGEAHFNAQSYSLDFGRTPERRELDYVRQTAASVETAKEVKIFGLNGFLIERYRRLAAAFYAANRRLALRRAGWGGLFTAIGTVGYYLAYAYIAWRTLAGEFSIGDLTFLAGSFRRLRTLLEGLLSSFSTTAGQALYLNDLFSFFEVEPEILSPENPLPFPQPIRQGFVFEDVGFIYPGAERWAVRHLSFTLNAGEVRGPGRRERRRQDDLGEASDPPLRPRRGPHPARWPRPARLRPRGAARQHGRHLPGFRPLQSQRRRQYRGGPDRRPRRSRRIERAAERSQADEVIAKLPGGYEQMIGKRFKNGVELSGGEWQKIAIARAYMREAEVLILDEPTAALDARAEFEVFQRFKELSKGKTAVLISHRFSSVRMADRILVLADGKVEAAGTHEELLAQPGRYAELFELQAAGYR